MRLVPNLLKLFGSHRRARGQRRGCRFLLCGGMALVVFAPSPGRTQPTETADMVLLNGKVLTVDSKNTVAQAVAIKGERILAVGSTSEIRKLADKKTSVVELNGRTVIPGLIDSHIHAVRDGLSYSTRVDLEGAKTIADVLAALRNQARQEKPGQWILVNGGWHQDQLAEHRAPTQAELDLAAPDHPVVVVHQFDFFVLNRLAMQALNISRAEDVAPLKLELDARGEPTGVVTIAGNSAYMSKVMGKIPNPDAEDGVTGTLAYFRALNRVAITGFTSDDSVSGENYQALFNVWRQGRLTVRVRLNLMTREKADGKELADIRQALQLTPPLWGDNTLRILGLGEIITWGMYDGNYLYDLPPRTAAAKKVALDFALWAAQNGYPIEVHSARDETTKAYLDVFEEVNKTVPIAPLRWKIAHCEDCSVESLRRMKALGMGWNVQDRMYFGGDTYIAKRGAALALQSPRVQTASRMGIVVSGGTDATVIAPYNPFISLRWFITGKTLLGRATRGASELPSRAEALRFYTINSAWTSFEERERGSLEAGKLADLAVLDRDYMTVPEDDIGNIKSLLTMVGGEIVFADKPFN